MSKTIQVVLSDDEHNDLVARAEQEGRKKSNMARKLIKDGLKPTFNAAISGSDLIKLHERAKSE